MSRFWYFSTLIIYISLIYNPAPVSATSLNRYSFSLGEGSVAGHLNTVALGYYTKATANQAASFGSHTEACCHSSLAAGYGSTASGSFSFAMGNLAEALSSCSIAMGSSTTAGGIASLAMGLYVTSGGDYSTAFGSGSAWNNKLENNQDKSFMVGYMYDSTDTTPELFVKDKGVGINTTSPATMFHVQKNISSGASMENHVAVIENTSTGTSPDVLMLKVNNENPTNGCNFISFADVNGNLGSIEGNGGSISFNTSGGDFAEHLPKSDRQEAMAPGDIVGFSPEGLNKNTAKAQRLMVITTAPAVLGNQPHEGESSAYAPVAFLGQVPVNTRGPVRAGDCILPSGDNDGTGIAVSPGALKPPQYGMIVGQSLESNPEEGLKKVNVIVGLPLNGVWNVLGEQKDNKISQLEARLTALENDFYSPSNARFTFGACILFGVFGFLWGRKKNPGSRNALHKASTLATSAHQ